MHRSARHIALAQVGEAGQARLAASTVLVMGAGGIGCATAAYLVSAGIGHVLLCDFDTVDASNLGRQTLYRPDDVGKPKAAVAARRLLQQNPEVVVTPITNRLSNDALAEAVDQADAVLDGTDNFATRFQVSNACVAASRCLISGSAIRFEGQLAVFGPDYDVSPCYRCLYTEADESLVDCAGNGVLAPVPGVIGTMMATSALSYLAGIEVPTGRLTLLDAITNSFRSVSVTKRSGCVALAADKGGTSVWRSVVGDRGRCGGA